VDNLSVENILHDPVQDAAGNVATLVTTIIEWDLWLHKDLVMNANHSYRHWSEKNNKAQDLKMIGRSDSRKLGRYKQVRMDVVVSYPVNRQRDVNNLQPTMKHYIDGLVDRPDTVKGQKQGPARGFLADDDDTQFRGPFMEWSGVRAERPDRYKFHIKLTITG